MINDLESLEYPRLCFKRENGLFTFFPSRLSGTVFALRCETAKTGLTKRRSIVLRILVRFYIAIKWLYQVSHSLSRYLKACNTKISHIFFQSYVPGNHQTHEYFVFVKVPLHRSLLKKIDLRSLENSLWVQHGELRSKLFFIFSVMM